MFSKAAKAECYLTYVEAGVKIEYYRFLKHKARCSDMPVPHQVMRGKPFILIPDHPSVFDPVIDAECRGLQRS